MCLGQLCTSTSLQGLNRDMSTHATVRSLPLRVTLSKDTVAFGGATRSHRRLMGELMFILCPVFPASSGPTNVSISHFLIPGPHQSRTSPLNRFLSSAASPSRSLSASLNHSPNPPPPPSFFHCASPLPSHSNLQVWKVFPEERTEEDRRAWWIARRAALLRPLGGAGTEWMSGRESRRGSVTLTVGGREEGEVHLPFKGGVSVGKGEMLLIAHTPRVTG